VRLYVSVPLVKGDRVGTRLIGKQGAGHVVHVCLKGGYVREERGKVCCFALLTRG